MIDNSFASKVLMGIRLQLVLMVFSAITIIAFISVFTYLYFAKDLKNKDTIMNRNNTGIILIDRNNIPFFTFYEAKNTEFVQLKNIPIYTQEAVVAAEDKDFYHHPGFSLKSIIRSIFLDIKAGDAIYGGSTITQQLVKNVLLNSKKSILRKYQEIVLAQEIERRYSKKEILEMYLNSVYFGEGSFGIEQAAKTYFGKSASDLTLSESALLIGILPAPSEYSPFFGNTKEAKKLQQFVLSKMQQQGYISSSENIRAEREKIVYTKKQPDFNSVGAHFAIMVLDQLRDKYGEQRLSQSGFHVKTTVDLKWQKYAEQLISHQVNDLASSNVTNGSAVAIDIKTGEIRALVGSVNWFNQQFGKVNMADTPRSPGSSFKPIIYSYAFENRLITAATVLHDIPTTFPGNYKPQDYDRKWRGIVLVRRALANSLNVPAVEVMQRVGVLAGVDMARRFGITTLKNPSNYGLSLVLGTGEVKLLELTNAYAAFANNGRKNNITMVTSISDKQGHIIYANKPETKQVVEPAVAYIISSILSDSHARAEEFGNVLNTSIPAAVKTGTGEDYRNAFTVGYTPRLAVGVWLGNNDNSSMGSVAGSVGPAPVWKNLIEHYSQNLPIETFVPPATIVKANICVYNDMLASRTLQVPYYTEYFIVGTQPRQICSFPRSINMPRKESVVDIRNDSVRTMGNQESVSTNL
jgi:1A family penicillin-binding protein